MENFIRSLDDFHESQGQGRPYGTKKNPPVDQTKTLEELAFSELFGKPVKVQKNG